MVSKITGFLLIILLLSGCTKSEIAVECNMETTEEDVVISMKYELFYQNDKLTTTNLFASFVSKDKDVLTDTKEGIVKGYEDVKDEPGFTFELVEPSSEQIIAYVNIDYTKVDSTSTIKDSDIYLNKPKLTIDKLESLNYICTSTKQN